MATITSNNASSPIFGGLDSSYQLPTKSTKGSNELGQEQFLTLMIQQFRNQDPLKPQDPSEFLTQLAQARKEVATARAAGARPTADCAAEAAALDAK